MKNTTDLPKGYEIIHTVDLRENKKESIRVNIFSAVSVILTFILGNLIYPISQLFRKLSTLDVTQIKVLWVNLAIMIVLMLGFILLREAVHGIFMKIFCKESKLNFSYRVVYAYVSSDAYYNKIAYSIIALAPLVILGIMLIVANIIVSKEYFWTVFVIQMLNCCGAASDIYVFAVICKLPKDVLIFDSGNSMRIYGIRSKQGPNK